MRVLITGAAGQLGTDLRRLLPDADAPDRHRLSITDRDALLAAVRGHDVVLNCAAHNGVDAAESDPAPVIAVNAEGAANVARACRRRGARLVHFSTNYVFDGAAPAPYVERDRPSPLGAYARSKLEGERLVLEALPSALVVRSSGLFGVTGAAVKGGSFPARILARAAAGQPLRVVADQRLNPTYTADLARGALELLDRGLEGVVHLVAAGCCSYWELAVEALRLAGLAPSVAPVTTAELGAAAPRPPNGCLASERVSPLPDWRTGLAAWWTATSGRPSRAGQPVSIPRP
jgi:dTDP-4-dehydrorhamnose reductase